jgi:hypothetical protein
MSKVEQLVIVNHGKYKNRIAVVLKDIGESLEVKFVPKPVENFLMKNKVHLFFINKDSKTNLNLVEQLEGKIKKSKKDTDDFVTELQEKFKNEKQAGKRKTKKKKSKKKSKTVKIKKKHVKFLYLFI